MLARFERYPLTFGPTPIEKLNRLSAHLGGQVEIYAKREDCNSGLAFGGLGYVGFAEEVRAQEQQLGFKFDYIIVCTVTGSTHAGMVVGFAADDIVLHRDYAYPAYGIPSEETNDAIRLCARLEGMLTDPVYEGKSMQGLIDLVRKGEFPTGAKVLFAHLGGVPEINGYSDIYRNG
jgi:1-aminocyclopropane-1-carboxylate deaminase